MVKIYWDLDWKKLAQIGNVTQSKAKEKKKGASLRASMSLIYIRINRVPKYIIYIVI